MSKPKILVILANLGGPDSLAATRPFLFNLFYDKAILNFLNPFRFLLAKWISFARQRKTKKIYSLMGGKSPILENTLRQARHLKRVLEKDFDTVVIPVMRYWRPRATDALNVLKAFKPEKIIFLPLYPQFSTTTTKSSVKEWQKIASEWQPRTVVQDSHFNDPYFIAAHQELIKPILLQASEYGVPRILFSAHGLPQKIIDGGDPYQWQIEKTVELIMEGFPSIEWVICYQSKVGPIKWLGPSTEKEIKKASDQRKSIVVVPVSFVSEHSETLVELDIDYAAKAKKWGVPFYGRVPALGESPLYIKCLENIVRQLIKDLPLN